MEDYFSNLSKSLQSLFHLESMRNGKYTYPAVQQLKDAIENYHPKAKNTFVQLLRALKEALPYIEKWRINFDSIRKSMDQLAKIHQMPTINWNLVLAHPKVSSRFQFSALNHARREVDLRSWLTSKTDKSYFQLQPSEITHALLENINRPGFSQKLSTHLKKYPDFLFRLIMDSEENFTKICKSRLILYLTDKQIAQAIIQHIPTFINQEAKPFEQVTQLVHTLNEILSNGRSVSTLLRNAQATPVLLNSIFFQLYQSERYQNHQKQASAIDPVSEQELADNELLNPDSPFG